MFIKAIPEKSSGRVLINLCTSTHLQGKQIQRTVRRIGYLDEFSDKYPDPIALFKEEARRMPPSTGKDDSPSFYVSTLLTKVQYPRESRVETNDGRQRLIRINERQIVFWSEKCFTRQKAEREKAMLKAMDRATNGENSVVNNHAANRYIRKVIFDSVSGKEIESPEFVTYVDSDLIRQEEELDGYYMIRTNVVGTIEGENPDSFNGAACRWHSDDNWLELNNPSPTLT